MFCRTSPRPSPTLVRIAPLLLAVVCASLWPATVQASEPTPRSPAEYAKKAASTTGYTESELLQILNQAKPQLRIVELMDKPAEKALTWHQYHTRIVTTDRVSQGKQFMATYAVPLARAEATYGVPKEIIAAIIGLETRFGANKGNYRVLDSLSTLSFNYPRRAAFFQKELTAFLVLAKQGQVDPLALKGSYAGAIGWPQFMPSNISKLGADFDQDGRIDLYNSPVDAIGSVAKYFAASGWRTGQQVARPAASAKGSDLTLEGAQGPTYFHVEHNFKVILRYNRSNLYAMAVLSLSEYLR